ncbi:DUF4258 domain-containing protein [Candidatus Sumerlaeota bacterium]|nr:DUF4258 domain-containing protein [Candidatus Sumerlaeota bacterium]
MFEAVLKRMRDAVRQNRHVVTVHARKEMNEDALSIFDVESAILRGSILERQRDPVTGERKYRIRGETVDSTNQVEVIAKISPTGKVVIITVYMPYIPGIEVNEDEM